MSQFPPAGYYDPTAMPEPRRTSGLSITALVFSLLSILPCCVITAPLGVLLGLIGLVTIKPPKKGKGLCVAAVIIGVITLAVWGYVGVWSYKTFFKPMMEGPQAALTDAYAGNNSGFKSWFYGAGAAASDDEVKAFVAELRNRYGEFQRAEFGADSRGAQPQFGQDEAPFPYRLTFTNATGVKAEGHWVFVDRAAGGQVIMKMRSLTVFDSANGDLVFPGTATGAPARGGAPTAAPDLDVDPDAPATAPNG